MTASIRPIPVFVFNVWLNPILWFLRSLSANIWLRNFFQFKNMQITLAFDQHSVGLVNISQLIFLLQVQRNQAIT